MQATERFVELMELIHQRMLEKFEIDELGRLSQELGRPNPLLPAEAAVIAKIVVVNQQGLVLVVWRSDKTPRPGQVDLPGGGVDFGENPVDGVIRETREEAGLEVKNVRVVEAYGCVFQERYVLMLGYIGESLTNEVKLSWEHERFAWMSFDEALGLEGWEERHMPILTAARDALSLIHLKV